MFAKGLKTLAFCPGVDDCAVDSDGFDCICPKLNFGGSLCGDEKVPNEFAGACAEVFEGSCNAD